MVRKQLRINWQKVISSFVALFTLGMLAYCVAAWIFDGIPDNAEEWMSCFLFHFFTLVFGALSVWCWTYNVEKS